MGAETSPHLSEIPPRLLSPLPNMLLLCCVCLPAKILWERTLQPYLQPPQPCGEGVLWAGVSQPGWEPGECSQQRGPLELPFPAWLGDGWHLPKIPNGKLNRNFCHDSRKSLKMGVRRGATSPSDIYSSWGLSIAIHVALPSRTLVTAAKLANIFMLHFTMLLLLLFPISCAVYLPSSSLPYFRSGWNH